LRKKDGPRAKGEGGVQGGGFAEQKSKERKRGSRPGPQSRQEGGDAWCRK